MALTGESPVSLPRLLERACHYAAAEGATPDTVAGLASFLRDPATAAVLELPAKALHVLLVNDAYKPRMHKCYARFMPGVAADFELAVRRTPLPLAAIARDDPQLWAAFQAACAARLAVPPYPPAVVATLEARFPGFCCSQAMLARAVAHGVAPVSWLEIGGELTAFGSGPIEAASHVETTLTQLVQEVTLAAQVRRLQRERGIVLDPTELLAGALGRLAAGVARLAAEAAAAAAGGGPPMAVLLFAGRRSSSRRYLLLQNLYCLRHLPGYAGTSSVLAATLLAPLLCTGASGCEGAPQQRRQGQPGQPAERRQQRDAAPELRLAGTLAHELIMVTDQLLGSFNDPAGAPAGTGAEGGGGGGPAQVCALLAHLLLLAAGGGVHQATALSDTFGTRGFVAAALAAAVPEEFQRDMRDEWGEQWAAAPAAARVRGSAVFDLFAWWRLDSGDYEEMAGVVVGAWERRWAGTAPEARPPRPRLMHSNLDSYDEALRACRLPPRIRPAALAFGTLADGFPPLCPPAGGECATTQQPQGRGQQAGEQCGQRQQQDQRGQRQQQGQQEQQGQREPQQAGGLRCAELRMASVVMKAVQARHPCSGAGALPPRSTESAGKVGDDASHSKMQFDRRLPPEALAHARARLLALAEARPLDPGAVSAALAAAYHAVTRQRVLC